MVGRWSFKNGPFIPEERRVSWHLDTQWWFVSSRIQWCAESPERTRSRRRSREPRGCRASWSCWRCSPGAGHHEPSWSDSRWWRTRATRDRNLRWTWVHNSSMMNQVVLCRDQKNISSSSLRYSCKSHSCFHLSSQLSFSCSCISSRNCQTDCQKNCFSVCWSNLFSPS